jgi:hypothetical protein
VPVTLVTKGQIGNDSFFISTEMGRACDEMEFSLKDKGKQQNHSNWIAGLSIDIQNWDLLNAKRE